MERGVAEMTKKRIYILAAVILLVSCAAEIAGVHLHSPSWWPLPFGFVSGWILIILAKLIMAPLLQRHENYYTRGGGGHIE